MGRRTLRKIDPALDLSGHFRAAAELPLQFDPVLLFYRVQPLEVEVGSGKGLFVAGAAHSNPEHNFLGIELATKYARFAAARLAKQQAAYARMICGDALVLFRQWFPDSSLAAVPTGMMRVLRVMPDPVSYATRRLSGEKMGASPSRVSSMVL